MTDYKPSSIVASLCRKLQAIPVAEAIHPDGTVVVVVADGRKLTFDKDAITRTLTEDVVSIESAGLEGAGTASEKPRGRTRRGGVVPPSTDPATRVAGKRKESHAKQT